MGKKIIGYTKGMSPKKMWTLDEKTIFGFLSRCLVLASFRVELFPVNHYRPNWFNIICIKLLLDTRSTAMEFSRDAFFAFTQVIIRIMSILTKQTGPFIAHNVSY